MKILSKTLRILIIFLCVIFITFILSRASNGHAYGPSTGFAVQISGVTATQAILSYFAPNSNACIVEISESPNYLPLVHDVDPVIFQGSNSDLRSSNPNAGLTRTFVIGKRAAERGTDTNFYSRALQTNTVHYYRITCGSAIATGQFTTTNIPVGSTYMEQQPVDPNRPGSYAWPTLSFNDRSQTIIDPLSGLLLKRMNLPSDVGQGDLAGLMNVVHSDSWANPLASAVSNQGGAFTSSNAGTLFMGIDQSGYQTLLANDFEGYPANRLGYYLWYQVNVNAKMSGSCANSDDCKMVVCLTIDGANCYGGAARYETLLSSTYTNNTFGTIDTPIDIWQATGTVAVLPNGPQERGRTGTVTCDGSTHVTYTSGYIFGTWWGAGGHITINGIDHAIASVEDSRNLTLTNNCIPGTNMSYSALNFGMLIRKKTTSSNVLNVDSASAPHTAIAVPQGWIDEGVDLCSSSTVVGANGDPGYNCVLAQTIYWVDKLTGESHEIGGSAADVGGGIGCPIIGFLNGDGDSFYCAVYNGVIKKVTYVGNHLDLPKPNHGVGAYNQYEIIPDCVATSGPVTRLNAINMPCYIVSDIMGSVNIPALTNAFDPNFQNDRYVGLLAWDVDSSNRILISAHRGASATFNSGWLIIYDPNATNNANSNNAGCIGGGVPGCVVAARSSWGSPNSRWANIKGAHYFAPNWIESSSYFWGVPGDTTAGRGPFQVKVVNGGVFNNSSSLVQCPTNIYGATGTTCTTVQVDSEPYDASPCTGSASACYGATETGLPGELQNAAEGDYLGFTVPATSSSGEELRLIKKDANNMWTFQRNITHYHNFNAYLTQNSGPNPVLYFDTNSNPDPEDNPSGGGSTYWNFVTDPHGTNLKGNTVLGDMFGVNGHRFGMNGMEAFSGYSEQSAFRCTIPYGCYETRLGNDVPTLLSTTPQAIIRSDPGFASKNGYGGNNEIQTHPNSAGKLRTNKDSFLDGRPFKGALISGSGSGNGSNPATRVGGQLWKFTSAQLPYVDRKFMPSKASSGGHVLKDISNASLGDVISTDSTNSYEYCYANAANECRTGSVVGDLYVNAPYVVFPYCYTGAQNEQMSDENDICFGNNLETYDSITQTSLVDSSGYGETTRHLTHGLTRTRSTSIFWTPSALSDGSYMIVNSPYTGDGSQSNSYFLAKLPPFPAYDGTPRNTFMPVPVNITTPTGLNISNAIVEFGYAENGNPNNYFCTSRQESCVADGGSINLTTPFKFTSENPSGMPCTTSCSIIVPGIPQHVIYLRVKFRDSNNTIVATSNMQVAAVENPIILSSTSTNIMPPAVISSISVSSIDTTSATISWQTDTAADTQVFYGLTSSYGLNTVRTVSLDTTHSVSLSGLNPSTTYHFQLQSVDIYRNVSLSNDQNFTTASLAPNPIISNGGSGTDSSGISYQGGGPISATQSSQISHSVLIPVVVENSSTSSVQISAVKNQNLISSINRNTILNRHLSFDSHDDQVLIVQNFLIAHKFLTDGNATGYFGPGTLMALKSFQIYTGISNEVHPAPGFGTVGPGTRTLINAMLANPNMKLPTQSIEVGSGDPLHIAIGSIGKDVTTVQKVLVKQGFLRPLSHYGTFGPVTEKAVKLFQKKKGIVTYGTANSTGYGVVGPLTWYKIQALVFHK